MTEADPRQMCLVFSTLLEQGERLDRFSDGLLIAALALVVATIWGGSPSDGVAQVGIWISGVCGVAQKYFAIRVSLDAALFRIIAEDAEGMATVDRVLGIIGKASPSRPLEARIIGAMTWLRRQSALLAVQAVAIFMALGVLA